MISKMTKNIKPQIDEANEIAKSLAQEVQFDFKLTSGGSKDTMNLQEIETAHNEKYRLEIQVNNLMHNEMYHWGIEKFTDRLVMMRDLLSVYETSGEIAEVDLNDNPFIDVPQASLIGTGYYKLEPLGYLIDNPSQISLIGSTFKTHGNLFVNIIPLGPEGQPIEEMQDDQIPEEPEDLLGQEIKFVINIDKAADLPENFCKNVYVEY